MKIIAILGTGSVGQTYTSKFISLGYDVMAGTRNVSEKLAGPAKDGFEIARQCGKLGFFVFISGRDETCINL